jgi:phosphatidate cytidylyltransferase
MLLKRVVTAVVLVPPGLAAVWFLPGWAFAILVALLTLLGAWEWAGLMRLDDPPAKFGYTVVVGLCLVAAYAWGGDVLPFLLGCTLLWWSAAAVWVTRYPAGFSNDSLQHVLKALVGIAVLVPSFLALSILQQGWRAENALSLFFLLVLIWAADTGAYFAGRAFGKTKLAPRVSPGKTWEGAAGGFALSAAVAAAGGHWVFHLGGDELLIFVTMCVIVVAFSIVGDLTESMFKRHAGVKDSGRLFPGHGGVLDRFDSVFSAAPLFLGVLLVLGG